jgi:hypothetical protein
MIALYYAYKYVLYIPTNIRIYLLLFVLQSSTKNVVQLFSY